MGGWAEMKLKLTQFNLNSNCLFKLSLAKGKKRGKWNQKNGRGEERKEGVNICSRKITWYIAEFNE